MDGGVRITVGASRSSPFQQRRQQWANSYRILGLGDVKVASVEAESKEQKSVWHAEGEEGLGQSVYSMRPMEMESQEQVKIRV